MSQYISAIHIDTDYHGATLQIIEEKQESLLVAKITKYLELHYIRVDDVDTIKGLIEALDNVPNDFQYCTILLNINHKEYFFCLTK